MIDIRVDLVLYVGRGLPLAVRSVHSETLLGGWRWWPSDTVTCSPTWVVVILVLRHPCSVLLLDLDQFPGMSMHLK